MARKPIKYPKKLRATLERIQQAADELSPPKPPDDFPYQTCAMELAFAWKATSLYVRYPLPGEHQVIKTTVRFLDPEIRMAKRISVEAPWLKTFEPAGQP